MPIQIPELTEHSMVTWVSGFYKMMGESTRTILQYTSQLHKLPVLGLCWYSSKTQELKVPQSWCTSLLQLLNF